MGRLNKDVAARSVAFGIFLCLWITEPIASLTGDYCAIDASLSHVFSFASLCCVLVVYLVALKIRRGFSPKAWIAASLLLMMLNMVANDLVLLGAAVLPLPVSLFFYACYGAGLGFAMCCYADFIDILEKELRKRALVLSLCVAAALAVPYGLLLYADFVALVFAIGACGLASVVVLARPLKAGRQVGGPASRGDEEGLLFGDSIARVFVSMLALGVVAGYRIGLVGELNVALTAFFFMAVSLLAVVAIFTALFRRPAAISFLVVASKGVIALSVFALALFFGGRIGDAVLFTMVVTCFQVELFVYCLLYVTAFSYRSSSGLSKHLALIVLGGSLGFVVGNAMNLLVRPSLGVGDYACIAILLVTLVFSINGKMFITKGKREDDQDADAFLLAPEFSAYELETCAPAMATQYSLTHAQTEVFFRLLQGERPKAIAQRFQRSEATIRSHVSQIYLKMEVNSSDELLRKAHEFFDSVLS